MSSLFYESEKWQCNYVWERCWEAWDTICGHEAKAITPLIAWRREALKEEVLDNLSWKYERGPSLNRWILELFQRQPLRDWVECIWAFPSTLIPSWTELHLNRATARSENNSPLIVYELLPSNHFTSVNVFVWTVWFFSFFLQTEIELLKAHNIRLLNFPPLTKVGCCPSAVEPQMKDHPDERPPPS